MRHTNGRKRRLCLAFSKCIENHEAAVDISIAAYNWTHVIKTTGKSPAHSAGLTDHKWTLEQLIEEALATPEDQARPVAKPEPREGSGPTRALPNGRGFLRLVGGSPAPKPVAAPPSREEAPQGDEPDPWAEIENLPAPPALRPMRQLDLFPND